MLTGEEIQNWELSDIDKSDEEAADRVINRMFSGVREQRLFMANEEFPAVRHMVLQRKLIRLLLAANKDLVGQLYERNASAMGVFDCNGKEVVE